MLRYFFLIFLTTPVGCTRKPYTLDLLVLALDQDDIFEMGTRFAINWANNHTDILPDYHIEVHVEHEGFLGDQAAEKIIKFHRLHEGEIVNTLSPITVGPLFSPGCKAAGGFAHHIDHILLSPTCTATFLNNRKKYPNLFLGSSTHSKQSYGIVRFMKEIGGWNKFAMYTNPQNINDFNFAMKIYEVAQDVGMDGLIFDSILDFNHEKALELKQSNARVILIWSNSIFLDFFCQLYNVGIIGEKYVFISFLKEDDFSKYDCPDAIADAYERMFVLVDTPVSGDPDLKGALGYSRNEFDILYDEFLLNSGRDRVGDRFWQYANNDMAMQLVTILDESEKRLQSQNLTLRNFNTDRKAVMEVLYDEALHVNMSVVRADRIIYTDTQEPASIPQFLCYHKFNDKGEMLIRFGYELTVKPNAKSDNYESFFLKPVEGIIWKTKDGKPPKDFWTVVKVESKVNYRFTVTIAVFAFALSIVQISLLMLALVKRKFGKRQDY